MADEYILRSIAIAKLTALVKCSVCGFDCGANSFSYCPNCGAKMDGGKDNG